MKSEIESLGHTVMNIYNIKHSRTNTPQPLFFVDLKPSPNNKDIYLIENIHYTKIKFEPPRPKRTIPQCSKCQRYGHTKAYCFHSPDVYNAQVHILPHNVHEKTNPTTSHVYSAMATIQQTTKAVLFIKPYKREPSHHFEETKKSNIFMPSHTRTSLLLPPKPLLSNVQTFHPRLLILYPNSKSRIGNSRTHLKPIFKN
jgi:hypothetical protein